MVTYGCVEPFFCCWQQLYEQILYLWPDVIFKTSTVMPLEFLYFESYKLFHYSWDVFRNGCIDFILKMFSDILRSYSFDFRVGHLISIPTQFYGCHVCLANLVPSLRNSTRQPWHSSGSFTRTCKRRHIFYPTVSFPLFSAIRSDLYC